MFFCLAMAQSLFSFPYPILKFAGNAATAFPHPSSVLTPLQNDACRCQVDCRYWCYLSHDSPSPLDVKLYSHLHSYSLGRSFCALCSWDWHSSVHTHLRGQGSLFCRVFKDSSCPPAQEQPSLCLVSCY